MKRIIDGKRYNTETALHIGTWDNNLSSSDFSFCTSRLYRTKTGRYFLHGDGGPNSRWASSCGDMRGSGDGIEVLTEDDAFTWAQQHLDSDEIEAGFGRMIEDA